MEQEFWKNQAESIEQERLIRESEELRIAEEKAKKLRQAQLEEKAREAEKLRQVQLRQEERHWQEEVNSAKQRVQKLLTHGEIDKELAKEFIRESAFWDHPSGSMVSAPKHASRIYGSPNNWRIDFGANTFLVGQAIWRCQETILYFIEKAESGNVIPIEELREKLEDNVRGSVANHEGDEYEGYYSAIDGNCMIFGTQAINYCNFVNLIIEKAKLEEIFKAGRS